ncbi:MAG: tetratricopeptide repeat protein [Gammaproteobacteria bacterium]|jgi:tetratricopeptide (TPR) repeat protein
MKFFLLQRAAALSVAAVLLLPVALSADQGDVFDNPEMMFHFLAAEVAVGQGDLESAFKHYMEVVPHAPDVDVASRATRIGLHIKSPQTIEAAQIWTELAPDDLEAWQALLILRIKAGDIEGADTAVEALMRAAEKQGKDGFMQIAIVVSDQKELPAAREIIESLAKRHADDAGAQYALGVALFGMKDDAGAETALRKALALNKADPRIWLLLSRVYEMQEKEALGEETLREGLEELPENQLLRLALAERLVSHEKYEGAYEQFRILHDALPANDEISQALGGLTIELGKWEEAREIWNALLDKPGRRDRAHYFLAQVEQNTGNPEAAYKLYEKVDGLLMTDARIQMSRLLVEQEKVEEALKLLTVQRLLSPEDAIRLYLEEATVLSEAGRDIEVMELLDKALEEFPLQSDLLYARALQGEKMGDIGILERDLRQVLEQDPDHAQALNALGYTLADETTRYEEAYELISKAYALMPDSAAILDSMGWVHYRRGNLDEAIEFLEKAAAADDDGEIAAHLGEVYWVKGWRDKAMKVWMDALQRDPENPYVVSTMERLQAQ